MFDLDCRVCGGVYFEDPKVTERPMTHRAHACSAVCLVAAQLEHAISRLERLDETLSDVGSRRGWWKW